MHADLVGKTALVSRLVAHTFETQYRPTGKHQQHFWRYHEEEYGRDILVEIEDSPGIELGRGGGALSDDGMAQLQAQLKPLVWFEKFKKDGEKKSKETDSLLGGKGKRKRPRGLFENMQVTACRRA